MAVTHEPTPFTHALFPRVLRPGCRSTALQAAGGGAGDQRRPEASARRRAPGGERPEASARRRPEAKAEGKLAFLFRAIKNECTPPAHAAFPRYPQKQDCSRCRQHRRHSMDSDEEAPAERGEWAKEKDNRSPHTTTTPLAESRKPEETVPRAACDLECEATIQRRTQTQTKLALSCEV